MKNRGEIVSSVIDNSGFARSVLAKRLGIDRKTLYNKLMKINLDVEFIKKVGKIINYDFSKDFPELFEKHYILPEEMPEVNDPEPEEYNLPECKKKLEQMRIKYIALFEKYTELLEKKAG